MKKGLLLLVVLLCLTTVLGAMAYNSATVANAASVTVTSTDEALLALTPSENIGNKDDNAKIVNDNLVIDLAKGNNGNWGVQKNSQYVWEELFTITNNSNASIDVALQVRDKFEHENSNNSAVNLMPGNCFCFIANNGGEVKYELVGDADKLDKLPAGESLSVKVTVDTYGNALKYMDKHVLVVSATAVEE